MYLLCVCVCVSYIRTHANNDLSNTTSRLLRTMNILQELTRHPYHMTFWPRVSPTWFGLELHLRLLHLLTSHVYPSPVPFNTSLPVLFNTHHSVPPTCFLRPSFLICISNPTHTLFNHHLYYLPVHLPPFICSPPPSRNTCSFISHSTLVSRTSSH